MTLSSNQQTYAVRIHEHGGPDKLSYEKVTFEPPSPHEALVRNTAIGLNFVDTYYRSGLYGAPLPMIPGSEGAGVVEAVGKKVKDIKVGDRVAYVDPLGAYAQLSLRPAERLVKLPSFIDEQTAAAMMLKGLTAYYLIRLTYEVSRGETILVHAAAGGVGQILCAWAKSLGVTVLGTVGSAEKVKLAQKVGCKHVIITTQEKFSERVKTLTHGRGVPVVYDGVGKDTFLDSLDCLSPRGLMVSFGNASGAVTPFEIATLAKKGSLYLTRPTLKDYVKERSDLLKASRALFAVVKKGDVKVKINRTYPLREAALAQADLEARKTMGSTILIP